MEQGDNFGLYSQLSHWMRGIHLTLLELRILTCKTEMLPTYALMLNLVMFF